MNPKLSDLSDDILSVEPLASAQAAQPDLPAPTPPSAKKREEMNSGDIERYLRLYFEPPHYAFLTQVRNGTGFSRKKVRTADAIAMGTWPSRGIYLNGIEIKVSYSDFKAELKNPEKAEDIAKYCHFWWLAVSHEKVAPIAEVPQNWGLLVVHPNGEKLRVLKEPVMLAPASPDHSLLASILRNVASDYIRRDTLNDWKNETRRELEMAADQNSKFLRESSMQVAKKCQEQVRVIEEAIGCSISEYRMGDFKRNYALAKKINDSGWQVADALQRLGKIVDTFRPELDAILGVLKSDQKSNQEIE